MHEGSCICKKVTFRVKGEIPPVHACHCNLCRKASGHFGVGADIDRSNIEIQGLDNISWYNTSDWVRRGFCKSCGTPLFFDPLDQEKVKWIGVSMGAFDTPTRCQLKEHIYVKDKGDYYELNDGLPQHQKIPKPS